MTLQLCADWAHTREAHRAVRAHPVHNEGGTRSVSTVTAACVDMVRFTRVQHARGDSSGEL